MGHTGPTPLTRLANSQFISWLGCSISDIYPIFINFYTKETNQTPNTLKDKMETKQTLAWTPQTKEEGSGAL